MKKPSATFRRTLLLLLIVPYILHMLGMFSSYVAFYHRSAFQMQVASKHEELKTLSLSITEFENIKWTEAKKEFEYFGKMYDVAKIEREGTKYLIYCENDSFEDLFINWLKSASKSKSKMLPQIQFVEPIAEFDCALPRGAVTPKRISTNLYLSFLREIIPPPPRVS